MRNEKFIYPHTGNEIADPHQHQSYGLTKAQMAALRVKQVEGTEEMMPANNCANIGDPFFKKDFEGYQIPRHEDNTVYHVATESRTFNQFGERVSIAVVKKFDPTMFLFMQKNQGFAGQLTVILHDPSKELGYKQPVLREERFENDDPEIFKY
ncbi:MAG: hypothetical protein WKF87_17855 [Chryseolinea sp.]